MTTCLGKSYSFGLPREPFVNCCQFMHLVISFLVLRTRCGIWLYQFLIIAYLFTLLSLMWVYFSVSILAENRRMSYAVTMNMDNTDTSLTWKKKKKKKKRESLQILPLAYKNGGFKMLCRDSICLCFATLSFWLVIINQNKSLRHKMHKRYFWS